MTPSEAIDNLIIQWRDKPRAQSLLLSYVSQSHATSETLDDLIDLFLDVDACSGDMLDQIGHLVGQQRYSDGDYDYRRRIITSIPALKSRATTEELYSLINSWVSLPSGSFSLVRHNRDHHTGREIQSIIIPNEINSSGSTPYNPWVGHDIFASAQSATSVFSTTWATVPLDRNPAQHSARVRHRTVADTARTASWALSQSNYCGHRIAHTHDYFQSPPFFRHTDGRIIGNPDYASIDVYSKQIGSTSSFALVSSSVPSFSIVPAQWGEDIVRVEQVYTRGTQELSVVSSSFVNLAPLFSGIYGLQTTTQNQRDRASSAGLEITVYPADGAGALASGTWTIVDFWIGSGTAGANRLAIRKLGADVYITAHWNNLADRIYTDPITYVSAQPITIGLYPSQGIIVVSGATTGNGTYTQGNTHIYAPTQIWVGRNQNGSAAFPAFGYDAIMPSGTLI
jgi:hypothetical protein